MQDSLIKQYRRAIASGYLQEDPAQLEVIKRLQSLTETFLASLVPIPFYKRWPGQARARVHGIYLWGGVVQRHRGYMKRNQVSPYGNASIGMDKSYHYDANLDCNPPPFYPAVEFDDGSGEIDIKLIGYNSTY